MGRLLEEDDFLRNTDRMALRRGARKLKQVEPSHRAQAVPAERSDGARRTEDAVRRTIDNVIGRGRAAEGTLVARSQPGDGAENRVARLRQTYRASRCRGNGVAVTTLWPGTNGPWFRIVRLVRGHRIPVRHSVTSHRRTTVTRQIIATSCPGRTDIADEQSDQAERQHAASQQESLRRLNALPPHEMSSRNSFIRPNRASQLRRLSPNRLG